MQNQCVSRWFSGIFVLALVGLLSGCSTDFDGNGGGEAGSSWQKSYSNDRFANLVALDGDDNLYSATTLHMSAYGPYLKLFKTDSDGEKIWNRQITVGTDSDRILSLSFSAKMRLDSAENIGIIGTSQAIERTADTKINYLSGTHKAFFVKTSSDGTKLWEYIHENTDGESYGKSLALDNSGNYYLTGIETYDSYKKRTFVIKLTSEGNQVFAKTYPLSGNVISQNDIAFDGSSTLYVYGAHEHTIQDGNAGRTVWGLSLLRIDTNGNTIWQKTYEDDQHDCSVSGMAMDASGNLFLASVRTAARLSERTLSEGSIFKINSAGSLVWSKKFAESSEGLDINAVAVDTGGAVRVGGWIRGELAGFDNADGNRDPYWVKMSANGDILETNQLSAPQGSDINAISIGHSGTVYYSGFGKLEGESNYSFLIKKP